MEPAARRWQTMNRRHRHEIEGEPAPMRTRSICFTRRCSGPGRWRDCRREPGGVHRTHSGLHGQGAARGEGEQQLDGAERGVDEAVREFVAAILGPGPRNRFPQSITPVAERVAQIGAINSLTQTVLKLTSRACPTLPRQ